MFHSAMQGLVRKLLERFVILSAIDEVQSITDVDFQNTSNQLADSALMIGFSTKQILQILQDEVESHKIAMFFGGIRSFYTGSTHYICNKFSWDDEVLKNSFFVDFEKRKLCTFACVEYFLTRFNEHLPSNHADSIYVW